MMKRYNTYKRDELLIDYIHNHRGQKNAVSGRTVCEFLKSVGFPMQEQSLHSLITRIREANHAPILTKAEKGGCFWADTNEEIEHNIELLRKRISALKEHIKVLERFKMEDND